MKAFSRKSKKFFKKSVKSDIMFLCSLVSNSSTINVFENIIEKLFFILLAPRKNKKYVHYLNELTTDSENMIKFKEIASFEKQKGE